MNDSRRRRLEMNVISRVQRCADGDEEDDIYPYQTYYTDGCSYGSCASSKENNDKRMHSDCLRGSISTGSVDKILSTHQGWHGYTCFSELLTYAWQVDYTLYLVVRARIWSTLSCTITTTSGGSLDNPPHTKRHPDTMYQICYKQGELQNWVRHLRNRYTIISYHVNL